MVAGVKWLLMGKLKIESNVFNNQSHSLSGRMQVQSSEAGWKWRFVGL